MSRRGQISKRDVLPDPLYNSKLVTKLINNIMLDGKKGVAQVIVYDAFKIVEEKMGQNPLDVFNEALENVMPVLEVKARRVGGANYQVPMEVRAERRPLAQEANAPWRSALQLRLWMPRTAWAALSRRKKTSTRWQKPTRLSRITDTEFPRHKGALLSPFVYLKGVLILNGKRIFA